MSKILKCNRVTLYLSVFAKILQKDVKKYQKRHNDDTIDNTTHEESFETKKMIPKLETTKYPSECRKGKN
jgi:hypothetical protein